MAKLLFLQDMLFEYFAPSYLSAALKRDGHHCDVRTVSHDANIVADVKKYAPDAILVSSMTGPHVQYINLLKEIKKEVAVPVMMGGAHPTFFPRVLENAEIDYICVGEGEAVITEFATALDTQGDITKIPNIGFKEDGECRFNEIRPLQEDLDALAFPDRDLYYSRYKTLESYPTKRFLTSRGCPYNCTFCFNHASKAMYQGKGKYIRHRSAENIIEEILEVRAKYPLRTVRFPDDSFTLNKSWLLDFLKKYQENVKMPFTCLARANELDEETVAAFRDAGCRNLFFGVETASEYMRNKVLKKALPDEKIIRAASLLKMYKISFGTYNMIGLPGESMDDAFETIRFNHRIGTWLPTSTILQPYPGTSLINYAIEKGFLTHEPDIDSFTGMISDSMFKNRDSRKLINLNSFFLIGAWFPFLLPLIRLLITLPPNRLFRFLSFMSMGVVRLKAQNISPLEGLRLAVRFRKKV